MIPKANICPKMCVISYTTMLFYILVCTTEQRLIHCSLSTPHPVVFHPVIHVYLCMQLSI